MSAFCFRETGQATNGRLKEAVPKCVADRPLVEAREKVGRYAGTGTDRRMTTTVKELQRAVVWGAVVGGVVL